MSELVQYHDIDEARDALTEAASKLGATEFARVRNLDYAHAPYEIYPLAPRVSMPLERIVAFAVDMDGTSTTTEPLALHALEYMVRRLTNRVDRNTWPGLEPIEDHPFVIGNSNFRHTEFLVRRYRSAIDHAEFTQAYFEALCWTLACMDDPQRRRDITLNATNAGLRRLLSDPEFVKLTQGQSVTADNVGTLVKPLVERDGASFHCEHESALVGAALDIYYYRYHAIMREIEAGRGAALSAELLGASNRRLIEPMPGYDVFLALIKGWLGPEVDALYEQLRTHLTGLGYDAAEVDRSRPRLTRLAEHFRSEPAKLALVTASIAYETRACMREVIEVVKERISDWPLAAEHRDRLTAELADYRAVFDGFVCASDACETRLKPHRDLYSLALFQISIPRRQYPCVVGLEDTEPGIVALRAAGIGCAIALPNHDTSRQNYQAATQVINGGLPELILLENLCLPDDEAELESRGRHD